MLIYILEFQEICFFPFIYLSELDASVSPSGISDLTISWNDNIFLFYSRLKLKQTIFIILDFLIKRNLSKNLVLII